MCLEQERVEEDTTEVILKEGFFFVTLGRKLEEGERQIGRNHLGGGCPNLGWGGS